MEVWHTVDVSSVGQAMKTVLERTVGQRLGLCAQAASNLHACVCVCAVLMNPSKQHLLQKKALYEEGRIETPELLSSEDICVSPMLKPTSCRRPAAVASHFLSCVVLRWRDELCGFDRTGGERRAGLADCSAPVMAAGDGRATA